MIHYKNNWLSVNIATYAENKTTALFLETEDGERYSVISVNLSNYSECLPRDCIFVPLYKSEDLIALLVEEKILNPLTLPDVQQGYGTYRPYLIDLKQVDDFKGVTKEEIYRSIESICSLD